MGIENASCAVFPAPPIDANQCFLCRAQLTSENRTAEHVIPKWLQEQFKLWNEEIWLINKTSLPYRQATIPCCKDCNSGPLSRLESDVKAAFEGGVAAVRSLPEERLFQWCSKLFYGLFVCENRLHAVRSDPSVGPIVKNEVLEEMRTLHCFMQSIRKPFFFDGFRPFSLFVLETLTSGNPTANFDYYDALLLNTPSGFRGSLCIAIRAGGAGIICVLQDNGAQKEHMQCEFDKFENIPLHPCQFIELASLSICKASLLSYVPKYVSIEEPDRIVVRWMVPPVEYLWHDWEKETFDKLFSLFLARIKADIGQIYTPKGRISFLFDGSRPIRYDRDGNRLDSESTA